MSGSTVCEGHLIGSSAEMTSVGIETLAVACFVAPEKLPKLSFLLFTYLMPPAILCPRRHCVLEGTDAAGQLARGGYTDAPWSSNEDAFGRIQRYTVQMQ